MMQLAQMKTHPLNGFTVLANDSDPDWDTLTVLTTPIYTTVNGTLVLNSDGTYLYTPNLNFNGVDSFAYAVCDNGFISLCDTGYVTITVTPVNDAPVAVDDTASTDENVPVVINVPFNDIDVDFNLNISSVTLIVSPSNGSVTVNALNGEVTYTPTAGFAGVDTFEYRICDFGIPVNCDIAQVIVTVDAINHAPVAINDMVSVMEDSVTLIDPLLNDSDIDNNIRSYKC